MTTTNRLLGSRVWLYARSATNDLGQLSRQLTKITRYAAEQGYMIEGVTIEGGSGVDFNRLGLAEVREKAELGQYDVLLSADIARIGRDAIRTGHWIENLEKLGVIYETMDGYLTETELASDFKTLIADYAEKFGGFEDDNE